MPSLVCEWCGGTEDVQMVSGVEDIPIPLCKKCRSFDEIRDIEDIFHEKGPEISDYVPLK